MSDQAQNSFATGLLDDFFAEADDHLLGIRRELLNLEGLSEKAHPDPKIIESLLGHFHSFKGISAIVGLGAAEAAAHATEDFVRVFKDGQARLAADGLETLMAAALKLEQIVSAFRSGAPSPEYQGVLAELRRQREAALLYIGTQKTSPAPHLSEAGLLAGIKAARARGLTIWKCTFTPSKELSERGVSINTVREQLLAFGEILKSNPRVAGRGVITFEFVVASNETKPDVPAWETRGVSIGSGDDLELETVAAPALPALPDKEADHNPFLTPSHIVRVDLQRLDELMRITGEMVIHRSRLDTQLGRLNGAAGLLNLRGVQEVSGSLGRSLRELREAIMRVRLVPVAEIFARMPFVVRDLARNSEKKARLKVTGQDTAIDKYLIERLKDPLLHLVRNAFSHGVEAPEDRVAAAKPAEAAIELSARTEGDTIIIEVADDGRGISQTTIIERAKKLGLELPSQVDNLAVLKILCSSGFSTMDEADRAAGRGVGMGIVHATVRELGGTLALESEVGRGTKFTLRVPLTLAILETLIVTAAGQTCAIPQSFVREILHVNEKQIQKINGVEVVSYRSGVLPVVRLCGIFQLRSEARPKLCLLVVDSDCGSAGLLVDAVVGQREVVVRALRDPLIQVPGISGATELGDGKPVLILDAAALTTKAVRPPQLGGNECGTFSEPEGGGNRMSTKNESYVLFELAGSLYGLPSRNVQHIEMFEHVTLVPNANPAIDGVVFSRGQVIPALNLRVRFGFARAENTLRTRILFSTVHDRTVGLIVDAAREFRSLDQALIRPIEETLTGINGRYLKAVTQVDERLVLILDLEAVLNVADVQPPPPADSIPVPGAKP